MDSMYLIALTSEGSIPERPQAMVDALGKLMFNCGLIELHSKNLIWDLEPIEKERNDLNRKFWYRRTEGLKRLIANQNLEANLQDKCFKVIDNSRDLMEFRNSVAHGSLMELNDSEIKLYDSGQTDQYPHGRAILISDIKTKVDEAFALCDCWFELRDQIIKTKQP